MVEGVYANASEAKLHDGPIIHWSKFGLNETQVSSILLAGIRARTQIIRGTTFKHLVRLFTSQSRYDANTSG